MAPPSFNRIKAHFYLYETLYTFNFDVFKDKLLIGPYGRKSHYDNVSLLYDQGFIRSVSFPDEKEYIKKKTATK